MNSPQDPQKPRQYFPGEDDTQSIPTAGYETSFDQPAQAPTPAPAHNDYSSGNNSGYGQPQGGYVGPPQGPGAPNTMQQWQEPEPKKSGGGAMATIMGLLAGLAILAAISFGFLWRSAASEANKPAPAPVTVTETVESTVTETVTETETKSVTVEPEPLEEESEYEDEPGGSGNGNGSGNSGNGNGNSGNSNEDLDQLLDDLLNGR